MAQINPVRRLSLSLSSQKAGQKQKGQILAVSAQLMALVSALRSLSSVALSSARVSPVYHPFLTPLRQGDISTLQNRGHLYFALTVPAPWSTLMRGGQLLAALMLFVAFLQTDSLSFVGLRQLFETEKFSQLVTHGLYRVVRHPLYTFGLLFIWLTPTVSQNSLTAYIGATIYTLVGAYFEERKLLRDFGDAYAEYRRITPMLIPGLMLGKK